VQRPESGFGVGHLTARATSDALMQPRVSTDEVDNEAAKGKTGWKRAGR
jgi:hypothetical protein